MKKLESSLKNMALALTGFSVVAGGLLGWVNDVTAEPIAQANAKTLSDAIAVVVPGFDNNPAEAPETVEVNGATYKIYKATKGGQPIGAAVESASNGFGGTLTVLVGFDNEGNIIDYSLLSHSETPGLGSKAADWFKKGAKGDITGKNPGKAPLTVSKDGGDVDANYSYLHMENPVIAAPEHKLYAGANFTQGRWSVSTGIQYIAGLYTSTDPATTEDFVLWNLRGQFRATPWLDIWARGENLLAPGSSYCSDHEQY